MMGNWKKLTRLQMVQAVLIALSAAFVLFPLVGMFLQMDRESIRQVFSRASLWEVLGNSFLASALTTVIAVFLGYAMAWCTERTALRGKAVYRILVSLPMLIPSVSIGMGVIILGGNNGILTNLLHIRTSGVYGLPGILWGSVTYALPVAYLMIDNILKYEDATPYEAAKILGIPAWNQFWSITLPYLKKPMISVIFSVFTLSFTDYGVPLMVGGKYQTLPVLMYQEVIGQLNFGRGCVCGSMLLIPAVLAFLVDVSSQNQARASYVPWQFDIRPNKRIDFPATIFAVLLSAFCLLPILSFVVLAFVGQYPTDMSLTLTQLTKAMKMGAGRYLRNSVWIELLVAVLGTTIAVVSAYFSARVPGKVSRCQHLVFLSTGVVPGIVLGLAYVLYFKGTPLYGTIAILVIVNIVHFMSSPYLTMYNTFSKVNENLEAVGATMRIGRPRLLVDVLVPMCSRTIGEVFSYFFVNSMMTISAVSFLAGASTKPLALMINQFETQGQLEVAAVVSLMILLVNLVVKILMERKPKC